MEFTWGGGDTFLKFLKMPMKRKFLFFHIEKIAVYRSLISYLVPKIQSFEDAKIEGKVRTQNREINQNQSKLI